MKFYSELKSDLNQWRYKLIEMGPIRRVSDTAKLSNLSKSLKAAYISSSKKWKTNN